MASPNGNRNTGNRPSGSRPQGSRPQGSRPAGSRPQGSRPAGSRPAGSRPAGSRPQGNRPAGNRPQGSRPAGNRTSASNMNRNVAPRGPQKDKKRKQRNTLIIIAEVVVVCLLIIALVFITKLDKIHEDNLETNVDEEVFEEETYDPNALTDDFLVDESSVQFNTLSDDLSGYRNIAMFGVDSRNNNLGKGCRSDTIIIASINESTKEVKLASVYRDTYLNIGNDSYRKANSAYAYGGPKQAINMLNMNFDLNITDYVTVGWGAVADTVDALGGVTIDVDSAEITHLNNYQVETSQSLGRSYKKLGTTGMVNLDGIQAVSYCRIRYTAGDDYKRAERQREVIQALADKAQSVALTNPMALNTVVDKVFPQTATSLTKPEILELLTDIASYKIVDTTGYPNEQYRSTGIVGGNGDCVIPSDLATNVTLMHEFLFGETGYQPSSEVQSYSAKIRSNTGK